MPAARSASSARTARSARGPSTARQQPRSVGMRLPTSRIRWDRKLRVIMLGVFALVGWVGIHAAMTMLATRAQASAEQSLVNRLTRENASLERQATELNQTGTIIRDARALGMVRVGERAYVVTPGG